MLIQKNGIETPTNNTDHVGDSTFGVTGAVQSSTTILLSADKETDDIYIIQDEKTRDVIDTSILLVRSFYNALVMGDTIHVSKLRGDLFFYLTTEKDAVNYVIDRLRSLSMQGKKGTYGYEDALKNLEIHRMTILRVINPKASEQDKENLNVLVLRFYCLLENFRDRYIKNLERVMQQPSV